MTEFYVKQKEMLTCVQNKLQLLRTTKHNIFSSFEVRGRNVNCLVQPNIIKTKVNLELLETAIQDVVLTRQNLKYIYHYLQSHNSAWDPAYCKKRKISHEKCFFWYNRIIRSESLFFLSHNT